MTKEDLHELDGSSLEYQVFSLCFKEKGAINYFSDNLPTEIVGTIHGEKGVNELYESLLSFHRATNLDYVDAVAFKSWIESETDIYEALGGGTRVSVMLEYITELETSDKESLVELLKYKANKRKQINYLQEYC